MRTELASQKKGGIYISPATISRAIKVLKVSVLEQSWLSRAMSKKKILVLNKFRLEDIRGKSK